MTHIEQMIQDMCPNGVEFKTLGEVATLSRGKVYSKEYLRDNVGEYPVYSSQTANNGELGRINTYDYDGKFLTWTTDGAYAGTVFRREGKFSITNVCGLISKVDKSLSIDFLYYWLNKVAKGYVYQGMGNPKLMSNVMETIEIPIPPIEIQQRIVAILDRFSALAAELQAELQMRRKQYEYYRTQLLTPHSDCNSATKSDDCNWENVKFSDVASYIRGVTYNKHDELHEQSDSAIKVLRANNITLESNSLNLDEVKFIRSDVRVKQEQYLRKNDIFICAGSGSKEHVGKVAFINEDMDYTFGGFMGVVRTREKVTSKFLYYTLTSNIFKEYLIGALNSTTINNLNNTIMSEFSFMVPSLAEQERIVSILDKFEALTTSLSDGIPAEQAAQQKRYEYYRDLLLTFDRKAV